MHCNLLCIRWGNTNYKKVNDNFIFFKYFKNRLESHLRARGVIVKILSTVPDNLSAEQTKDGNNIMILNIINL